MDELRDDSAESLGRITAKESVMIGVTLARLALLPEMVHVIQEGSVGRTAALIGAAAVADLGDGIFARQFASDTNSRRIADATVDRVTILTASGALIHEDPHLFAWYAPLAVRGSVLAIGSNLCFWRRNKLVLGGNFHKLASISQAVFGVTLVADATPKVIIPIAVTTYAVNTVSGLDYFGAHWKELKKEKAENLQRVKIRKLLGLRNMLSQDERL